MTMRTGLQRLVPPVASALATAVVLVGALWVQHARQAWPFAMQPAVPAASPAEPEHDMTAMAGDVIGGRVAVEIDHTMQGAFGIRVEPVGREPLTQTVRAVATVAPDESRISHVHTRVAGWVEELDVNTTGEAVRAGQPLARIFSQEQLSSQIEYLAIRRTTAASGITSAVVEGGRRRLEVLGMTPQEIDAIEQAGEPRRLVTVVAPRSGVVVNRGVTVGAAVDPSTRLLTIADLSRVWVFAELPETAMPTVRVGTVATLDFAASGRAPFDAPVDFVYPTLTERTRTLRVRLSVSNRDGRLRPGLYGTAAFTSVGPAVLTVPRDAVVDTGLQQHVFVAAGERFEPRLVTIGVQLADRVEVRSGLDAGEMVVAAGVFLLDSESRLRATGGMGGHSHGGSMPADERPRPGPAPKTPSGPGPGAPDPHADHRE